MSTDLTVSEINLPPTLTPELAAAVEYAKAEKAQSTRKAYGTDFRIFREWCEGKGATSLLAQPETVASFLAAEADKGTKPSTLGRRVAAIRYAHKLARLDTPTDSEAVKATLRGIFARLVGPQGARGGCQDAGHGRDGSERTNRPAGSRLVAAGLCWCLQAV